MSTKVNLAFGKNYRFKFSYRSRPRTTTTTTNQWQCSFIIFCRWVPVTTTSTSYVGGGITANISSPNYTIPAINVGDVADWTESSTHFTWFGATGEATINMAATGPSDSIGTVIDDISLETTIPGSTATEIKAESLIGILPPHVPGLTSNDSSRSDIVTPIVVDKNAAIALGKALFWDQAVGSDQQSCASCHFHAGGDNRTKNQMSPGLNNSNAATRVTFENTVSGNKSGPNYTLNNADFPFNPNIDDVSSSQGTFSGQFQTSNNGTNVDECARAVGNIFHVNGVGTRNVEPRNSPTMIDAAYNHRNFWDGRANNTFNGVSPFGLRDTAAGVFINTTSGLAKQKLRLRNSSLASQAVGPVGSDFEMACRARQFADVGRKLLNRKPLALQTISPSDSVLAALPSMIGTGGTYAHLVQKAFAPAYWNGNCGTSTCGTPNPGVSPSFGYSHMEANFSLYFGLAVQMYEETLVSDDAKFDKWKAGLTSPTPEESRGESVFNGQGKCSSCHKGPTMTSAAILQKNSENVIEGMLMQNGRKAIYDKGYYNIAVVPTAHDIGNGGVDPWNNPLSFSRQYLSNIFVDNFRFDSCSFEEASADLCSSNDSAAARAGFSSAVDGAFKTPTLRNIALTGPYMHNGALATLEQVVDFYNRGGNFGTATNPDKHPDIQPLGLTNQQKSDLVAFMKTLTDDRVAFEKAPFDHPSLTIPNGHQGNQNAVTPGNSLLAAFGVDEVRAIPAVGSGGNSRPLAPFHQVLTDSPINKQAGLNVKSIAAGYDGTVLVSMISNNGILKYNSDHNWTQFPGAAIALAVVDASKYFAVGHDFLFWRSDNGGTWYKIGNNARAIAAASDGTVLGTTTTNNIWTYNATNNSYVNLPGLAKAVAIVNANTLFCIGMDNHVYRYNNAGVWLQVGVNAGSISAGSDGTVLVSNLTDNRVWKYVSDNNWVQTTPGTAKSLAVIANNRYFAIGTDNHVYRN
jgi:cytochrome c peroxidase